MRPDEFEHIVAEHFETKGYKKYWGILYSYGYETKIYDLEQEKMLNKKGTK